MKGKELEAFVDGLVEGMTGEHKKQIREMERQLAEMEAQMTPIHCPECGFSMPMPDLAPLFKVIGSGERESQDYGEIHGLDIARLWEVFDYLEAHESGARLAGNFDTISPELVMIMEKTMEILDSKQKWREWRKA